MCNFESPPRRQCHWHSAGPAREAALKPQAAWPRTGRSGCSVRDPAARGPCSAQVALPPVPRCGRVTSPAGPEPDGPGGPGPAAQPGLPSRPSLSQGLELQGSVSSVKTQPHSDRPSARTGSGCSARGPAAAPCFKFPGLATTECAADGVRLPGPAQPPRWQCGRGATATAANYHSMAWLVVDCKGQSWKLEIYVSCKKF